MDRDTLRAQIADAVGNPVSGPVADAIDRIVAVVMGDAKTEKRITTPTETRGQ